MLIKSLEQKTRLAMMTVMATIIGCAAICGFTVWRCVSLVTEERKQIYILDGDIPFLAERAGLEANFIMEAKAHIQLFHQTVYILYVSQFIGSDWNINILLFSCLTAVGFID